ncbi:MULTISPECIES: flagellar FlbD family protein [Anoxybacillus]|uniref:Flagellar protein FlbD n=2 Tax=Anoxybacillus TaxID=150247 RepID=A0A7X0DA69_9BACL|nr:MULTISPECIES: flagellar FlbD family protein [Anoxybacillus]MBB5354878.1 flagellar protein FlbD [Anoxybacillus mongoliensis]MBB6175789.1 flagellar protein FlbD [Anoxybacillus tengchongensis]MCX8002765.1 flagellar FlbD family protein [Anoxybacillus mongoliensis]
MIRLTRLNGKPFTLNAIYIEQVEAFPDTTITLTNGKKFVVRESVEDVMLLVETFYRNISVLGLRREAEGSDVEGQ